MDNLIQAALIATFGLAAGGLGAFALKEPAAYLRMQEGFALSAAAGLFLTITFLSGKGYGAADIKDLVQDPVLQKQLLTAIQPGWIGWAVVIAFATMWFFVGVFSRVARHVQAGKVAKGEQHDGGGVGEKKPD